MQIFMNTQQLRYKSILSEIIIESMQRQKHQKKQSKQPERTVKSTIIQNSADQRNSNRDFTKQNQKIVETQSTKIEDSNHNGASEFTVRVNGPEQHSHAHKRLKLKDYLHLNDLEKRSKPINTSRNKDKQRQRHKIEESFQQKTTQTSIKSKRTNNQVHSKHSIQGSNKLIAEQQYVNMIRAEVQAKIQIEKKKLDDLKTFLKQDFLPKQSHSQSFVFLFTIYNKLIDMHKINDEVGQKVKQYEKNENEVHQSALQANKNNDYHWGSQNKRLKSPAKILKQSLQMSEHFAQFLGVNK